MESHNRADGPKAYTLSQFSRFVASAMSREPVLTGAWVTAEISDMSTSGGHCYMTLIEKDASGATIARMRSTIWANRFYHIRTSFLRDTGKELANGMKVMFYGAANYHSSYGLSFNIGEINPAYTMGDLERLRREILAALQKEGILDRNRNLRLTEPPLIIAVISSETAAGYGDFINQLNHNATGIKFNTFLFHAAMQGERTARSVIAALDLIEQTNGIVNWDCVVIIRGGGATTDMNGFDDLQLARRVATYPLPIIVGIGHERDRCVLDEIACIRCKTPTAVATWLSDAAAASWQRACDFASRIALYASERLKGEQIRIQSLSALLPSLAREATTKANARLDGLITTLRMASHARIQNKYPVLHAAKATIRMAATGRIEKERSRLDNLEKLIDVLNPRSTLKRGYSITRTGGKAIIDTHSLKSGDIIETITSEGRIISTVTETE